MRKTLLMLACWLAASVGYAQDKLIVLTFDDGPRPKILFGTGAGNGLVDVLAGHSAHFFVQGSEAATHPEALRQLHNRGFSIENHTYGHDNLKQLYHRRGATGVLATVGRTESVILRATGEKPRYFRPPFWVITDEIRRIIRDKDYTVLELEKPDVNTLDYEDQAAKRSEEVLIARVKRQILRREKVGTYKHVLVFHELPVTVRALKVLMPDLLADGYRFGNLDEYFMSRHINANETYHPRVIFTALTQTVTVTKPEPIQAAYLGVDVVYGKKVVQRFAEKIKKNRLNAVVIDFKVDAVQDKPAMRQLVEHFHAEGYYVIGRIVVMQDHRLARARPDLALHHGDGSLWYSGARSWQRYWVDPASSEVLQYNVVVSKKAIDIGFDELNYDYIRFPSDGRMKDLVYPVWDGKTPKYEIMRRFFAGLTGAVRAYNPHVKLSVDIFGEAFAYGGEPGVGQRLSDLVEYFDVIAPMAYPSHYRCGEFGVKDPTAHPRLVYDKTIRGGMKILGGLGFRREVRPWIQDFSITSIYGCGPKVAYGPTMVLEQIRGCRVNGVNGFMLWNGASSYSLLPPDLEAYFTNRYVGPMFITSGF